MRRSGKVAAGDMALLPAELLRSSERVRPLVSQIAGSSAACC